MWTGGGRQARVCRHMLLTADFFLLIHLNAFNVVHYHCYKNNSKSTSYTNPSFHASTNKCCKQSTFESERVCGEIASTLG